MKKAAFAIIPLLVAGVVGAAMVGLIDIPGLSPAKRAKPLKATPVVVSAQKFDTGQPPSSTMKNTATPPSSDSHPGADQVSKPKTDPEQGERALGRLWNEMDSDKIIAIIGDWKDADVAKVFSKMDKDKVAEILGALAVQPAGNDPKSKKTNRASVLSKLIEQQASEVKTST